MPLVRALSAWFNGDHEGWVDRGTEFETSEYRARDLVTAGLAVYAVSDTAKVTVTADPIIAREPPQEPPHQPPQAPRQPQQQPPQPPQQPPQRPARRKKK